jgi:hypothetical protein
VSWMSIEVGKADDGVVERCQLNRIWGCEGLDGLWDGEGVEPHIRNLHELQSADVEGQEARYKIRPDMVLGKESEFSSLGAWSFELVRSSVTRISV